MRSPPKLESKTSLFNHSLEKERLLVSYCWIVKSQSGKCFQIPDKAYRQLNEMKLCAEVTEFAFLNRMQSIFRVSVLQWAE